MSAWIDEATAAYIRPENELVALLTGAPWRRVAVLGDSLAQGIGESSPGFADLSWAQRLHRTVQATTGDPVDHVNTGVIGARVADVLQTQLAPVTDFGPDLVGVVAGGNDLFVPEVDWTGLEAGLERLFDAVAALQARTVFTFALMRITEAFPVLREGPLHDRLERLNEVVTGLAVARGFLVVDMWNRPAGLDPSCYSSDLIHGSRRGHAALATAIVETLAPTLRRPAGDTDLRLTTSAPQRSSQPRSG